MSEVSGPVVGIALVLSSVFVPIGLMSGIQGRLNKQFAVTIAISVLISAFNALTLSPGALRPAPAAAPRGAGAGSARFFGAFNRGFARATHGYVDLSHRLIRKTVVSLADPRRASPCSRAAWAGACPPASSPRRTRASCS